jgi:hypothetical protein
MMEGDGVSINESGSGGNGTGSDGEEGTGTADSGLKRSLDDEDSSRPDSSLIHNEDAEYTAGQGRQ